MSLAEDRILPLLRRDGVYAKLGIVDATLNDRGELTFANAAADAGVAKPPDGYRATWSTFDNVTRESTRIGETSATTPRLAAPANLPTNGGTYLHVEIAAENPPHPSWTVPVHAYSSRTTSGWTLVGLERL